MKHSNHTNNAKWYEYTSSVVPGAIKALIRLVQRYGASNIHLVSFACGVMRANTNHWMANTMSLFNKTGLLESNVHFCDDRTGANGKGPIAQQLHLTHFIDDSDENLQAVYGDPAGNAKHDIDTNNGRLFWFAQSSRHCRRRARLFFQNAKLPSCWAEVHSWHEVLQHI